MYSLLVMCDDSSERKQEHPRVAGNEVGETEPPAAGEAAKEIDAPLTMKASSAKS